MEKILLRIKEKGIPHVVAGKARNIDDFFNQIIKPQFANKDSIKKIHRSLMEYINLPEAIFVLRLYGSDSNKIYNNLRRGFLTQYPDGKKTVFCDNTFAMPFVAVKITGNEYTTDELIKYMNDPSSRFGFGMTKEEKELAFYNWSRNGLNINLNLQGWYLAHMVPVGKDYFGESLCKYFPNPNRKEWLIHDNHIRFPQSNLSDQELSILKAHFMRMIHPLNSFIVPKRKLLAYEGTNIGEEVELISKVQSYLKDEFQHEISELNSILLNFEEIPKVPSSIKEIIWDANESAIKKEKTKNSFTGKKKTNKPGKSSVIEDKDIFDANPEEDLENTLRSIGKQTFIKLYILLKDNILIGLKEVYKQFPEYAKYTIKSQKARLSSSRSIIQKGLEKESLLNILNSTHLSLDIRKKAQQLLETLN